MTEYINKRIYKDTKSYKVLEKNNDDDYIVVIEVEKIPTNLVWKNRKCINAEEAFESAPITEVKNAKPFQLFKNKNGIWGVYKKVGHTIPKKVFDFINFRPYKEKKDKN